MIWIGLKLENKDSLLMWVWHNIELSHEALHARSRLFMAALTGQSYWTLVAQALLVDLFCCTNIWVLWVLWQVRVAQWWPTGGLGSQLGARALKSGRGLRILGLDAGPCSIECQSFVSLPLCLNIKHFIIYVLWYNSRTHVITHILGHVCDVLCVNGSVLTTRKDPSYD
jgi:hypothetical protein